MVDEVGSHVAWYCLDDGHHFLGSIEEACFGILLLSSCALACTAPVLVFLFLFLHKSEMVCIFAIEKAEVGEVSLPVWRQIQISNLTLTFQTLNEIASLIRLQSFRFSYSFQGFRNPLCQSLIDSTKVRKIFEITKRFQDYFKENASFPKCFYDYQRTYIS